MSRNLFIVFTLVIVNFCFMSGQSLQTTVMDPQVFAMDPLIVLDAGEDFPEILMSTEDYCTLSVEVEEQTSWSILVSFAELDWDPNLRLSIRNSNAPSLNSPFFNGSDIFQLVNAAPEILITGIGPVEGIHLQYELVGMSVILPVKSYLTEVAFSLIAD